MTQLLITTLIFSIITTILIVPITRRLLKEATLSFKQFLKSLLFVFIGSWIIYFLFVSLVLH